MIALIKNIVLALLLAQNPGNAPAPGIVTGTVRSADGKPAAEVRVYAMPVRDGKDAGNSPTVFESIAETDASGRFRLEVPPGRYYIAAGSVDAPTYFPGTTDLAAARVFSISSGAVIDAVDFSRFNAAVRSPTGMTVFSLPPGSTGVLSGVLRYPDGSPATGITVVANATPGSGTATAFAVVRLPNTTATCGSAMMRTSATVNAVQQGRVVIFGGAGGGGQTVTLTTGAAGSAFLFGPGGLFTAVTDNTGRYRIANVSPGTYQIGAGFADSPVMYPGVTEISKATVITTTPTTNLDNLDFTIAAPASNGITVSGRATALEEMPASGATIALQSLDTSTAPVFPLLPPRARKEAVVSADGAFEFTNVAPGRYCVEARLSGALPVLRDISVADQPVRDLLFSFPLAALSGRVLSEDGTPFPDIAAVGDVRVMTVTNPNFIATTVIGIDKGGTFTRILEGGEYRFYVRQLPDGYTIKSITSGPTDLLKETLKVTQAKLPPVEIRIAKRTDALEPNVRGKVVDNLTGKPPGAAHVELCCQTSGPFERFSTPVQADGSFEFRDIAPGRYELALRSQPALLVVNPEIEVGPNGVAGLTVGSMAQSVWLWFGIAVEGGQLPPGSRLTVTLTGATGVAPVVGSTAADGLALLAPIGDQYSVSVQPPPGFIVKSIRNGGVDLMNSRLIVSSPPPGPITIILARVP